MLAVDTINAKPRKSHPIDRPTLAKQRRCRVFTLRSTQVHDEAAFALPAIILVGPHTPCQVEACPEARLRRCG
jgi:hypothetical protein